MLLNAVSKERSLEDVRASLFNLVGNFEPDVRRNRKLMRELSEQDRALFYTSAIDVLKTVPDSRGVQYLVALLVANGMLLEALCDRALSKEQALALGRAAVRIDRRADAALARELANGENGQGAGASRLMEFLCEIGEPMRMMPSMLRLLRHPNPYLRSKAVKMVGRGLKSAKWARQRLDEADPRIRANAIETLWSISSEEARMLLQSAAADGNNRVAANGLLGLYYLGECSALNGLIRMAAHESGLFRSSAAWAMGQTGDVRFTGTLRRLLQEPDQAVRKRAFAALGQLKTAAAANVAGTVWGVAASPAPGEGVEGMRRVMVAVVRELHKEPPRIPGLGFVLSESSSYVTSYRVTPKPEPEAMKVVFLLPRGGESAPELANAVESCLQWKRRGDLWCILPYLESYDGDPPQSGREPALPAFTADAGTLRRALSETAPRIAGADLWTSLWGVSRSAGAVRGKRHIIVLSTAKESRVAGHGLIANVQTGRIPIHAIASGPNGRLQDFCMAVHAPFYVCGAEEIAEAVQQTYLSFLARYEIAYQPVAADAPGLKLRVQAPGGWGEAFMPYAGNRG